MREYDEHRQVALTVSIVSHGQGILLPPLLEQLDREAPAMEMHVVLTENIRDAQLPLFEPRHFTLEIVRNDHPKGFGANHNAAFKHCKGDYFAVLNPDLQAEPSSLICLAHQLSECPGVVGPRVLDEDNNLQDSARRIPNLSRLLRRVVLGERQPDYSSAIPVQSVDWLAGMCLMFDRGSFSDVGGFDERYHLYCEDVDICLRLHLENRHVLWVQEATVKHAARRDSHKKLRYLVWHLHSMVRLLMSSTYRRFCGLRHGSN